MTVSHGPTNSCPHQLQNNAPDHCSIPSTPVLEVAHTDQCCEFWISLMLCFAALQSSGIPDLLGSGAHSYHHYRISKDVVLRLEFIGPKDTKVRHCAVRSDSPRVSIVFGAAL